MPDYTSEEAHFQVPGGWIKVYVSADGTLNVRGSAEYGTYDSRLTILPAAANDVSIHLTRTDHRA